MDKKPLAAVLVLAVVVAIGAIGVSPTRAATPRIPRLHVQAHIQTGDLVGGLVSANGAVWAVAIYPREEALQIDPGTNKVIARIPLGGTASAADVAWITFGDGALWVSRSLAGEVDKIDPVSKRILARIAVDDPFDVAVAGESVFVPQFDPYEWSTINASTASVTSTHPSIGPSSAVFDNGAIWMLQHRARIVIRIDPQTLSVTKQIPVHTGGGVPERLAAGFGSVWATDPQSTSVARIDERTGRQVREIHLPVTPLFNAYGITTGGGYVWVGTDHGVARISPATNRLSALIRIGFDNRTCGPATNYPCTAGIVYADGSVFVADWYRGQILRIAPR